MLISSDTLLNFFNCLVILSRHTEYLSKENMFICDKYGIRPYLKQNQHGRFVEFDGLLVVSGFEEIINEEGV
jgi:hypothetical protein